jgi:hypothetical protein
MAAPRRISLARTVKIALCSLVVAALLLSGMQFCLNEAQAVTPDQQIILRCAVKALAQTNPLNADEDDWQILNLIYEGATKTHPGTGERVPYIAVGTANGSHKTHSLNWGDCSVGNFGYSPKEIWEDPGKPEITVFYDFEDVYWHDGVRMGIRDIMFSFHVQAGAQVPWLGHPLADKAGGTYSNYTYTNWLHIYKVYESQDGTRAALKFVLQKPLFGVFDTYFSSYIMPYHIWGGEASNQTMNNTKIWCDAGYNRSDEFSWKSYFAAKWSNPWPIGSGPFSWGGLSGNRITLNAWWNHFYKPGFKYYSYDPALAVQPQIGILSLRFYSSEEQAIMDLEADRLDYIAWALSPSDVGRFVNHPDIVYTSLQSTSMVYMGFNMRRRSFGYDRTYDGAGYTDTDYGKPLRKAIAHCIDVGTINAMANSMTPRPDLLDVFREWKNSSAPSYPFDPAEAISILLKAGYILNDPAQPPGVGNWWSNPDGGPIGSSPGGKIEILTTEPDYDPTRYNIATALVSRLRATGINAELAPREIGLLQTLLDNREFDVCIARQEIIPQQRSRPEIYYYGNFHSATRQQGPNYYGYKNSSFDANVLLAMSRAGAEAERKYVQDSESSIAYDVPIAALYCEINVEVHRASNFEGLVDDGSGSLLNARSMAGARWQEKAALKARFMGIPLTVQSNSTRQITVRVTDQRNNLVSGAEVTLEASSGRLLNTTGMTDQNGQFSTNFTAPYVPLVETYNNMEAVKLRIKTATMSGYRPAQSMEFTVTVFPEIMRSMFIEATGEPDVVTDLDTQGNPGFMHLTLRVKDMSSIPLGGAALRIMSADANLTFSDMTVRTDQGGSVTITVFAPDVDTATEYNITINATKGGFINASQKISFTVLPRTAEPELVERLALADYAVPAALVILLVILVAMIYGIRKRAR